MMMTVVVFRSCVEFAGYLKEYSQSQELRYNLLSASVSSPLPSPPLPLIRPSLRLFPSLFPSPPLSF